MLGKNCETIELDPAVLFCYVFDPSRCRCGQVSFVRAVMLQCS